MTRILRIDSSSRKSNSISRRVGDHLESSLLARDPATQIQTRDLADNRIPHIKDETIAGYYTPTHQMTADLEEATALSDTLIAELFQADLLILTVPMYNFSVPSSLKAWIDHIVRINRTFAYDGVAFKGLLPLRTAHVVCAYGATGYGEGQPFAAADFAKPYLAFLLGFLGIKDIRFHVVEATTADADTVERNVRAAMAAIDRSLTVA